MMLKRLKEKLFALILAALCTLTLSGQTVVFGAVYTDSNNNLILDGTSILGVGTANPQSLLHIVKSSENKIRVETTASTPTRVGMEFFKEGTLRASIQSYAGVDNLEFYTGYLNNSVPRMVIAGEGNVGIGTTNPTKRLDVQQTDGNANIVRIYQPGINKNVSSSVSSLKRQCPMILCPTSQ